MSENRSSRTIPHRNLPLLLLQARERVLAHFRPLLNDHGFTEQQWRIVRALLESGPMEPREIVERCSISSPSLAGVLQRMEDTGMVRRERLEHDQRRLHVSLTDDCAARATAMLPLVERTYSRLEARVGRLRLAALYEMLDEVIERAAPDQGSST